MGNKREELANHTCKSGFELATSSRTGEKYSTVATALSQPEKLPYQIQSDTMIGYL